MDPIFATNSLDSNLLLFIPELCPTLTFDVSSKEVFLECPELVCVDRIDIPCSLFVVKANGCIPFCDVFLNIAGPEHFKEFQPGKGSHTLGH